MISIKYILKCYPFHLSFSSCLAAIAMSFLFIGFGRFEGVKLGTVFCALVNGSLIGICSRVFDRYFDFADALGLRKIFE